MQTEKGQSIEDASMQMIEDEIGVHSYAGGQWQIVRRIIHSTADFDFAAGNRVVFGGNAVDAGIAALKSGCDIVVDVSAVLGGLNKQNPRDFGNRVICNIAEPRIAETAKSNGWTRSQAAMRSAARQMNGGIVAIGNAPTALLEVIRMVQEGATRPALIVGIPVGFISAAESKEKLSETTGVPFVTNVGRKGGSPAASAIINALYKLARHQSAP